MALQLLGERCFHKKHAAPNSTNITTTVEIGGVYFRGHE